MPNKFDDDVDVHDGPGRVVPFLRPRRRETEWDSFEPDDALDDHGMTFALLVWCPICSARIGQQCRPRGDVRRRGAWGICEGRFDAAFDPGAFDHIVRHLPDGDGSVRVYIREYATRAGADISRADERARELRRDLFVGMPRPESMTPSIAPASPRDAAMALLRNRFHGDELAFAEAKYRQCATAGEWIAKWGELELPAGFDSEKNDRNSSWRFAGPSGWSARTVDISKKDHRFRKAIEAALEAVD